MADVPDHLVPIDGLTDSAVRFDSLTVLHDQGKARATFGIYDENASLVGNFEIDVTTDRDSSDAVIAEAHRVMCDVLRQWLYTTDVLRQSYEKREGLPAEDIETE